MVQHLRILGNNESFEPYTQNLYVRRVLSGEFVQVGEMGKQRYPILVAIHSPHWEPEARKRLWGRLNKNKALNVL